MITACPSNAPDALHVDFGTISSIVAVRAKLPPILGTNRPFAQRRAHCPGPGMRSDSAPGEGAV